MKQKFLMSCVALMAIVSSQAIANLFGQFAPDSRILTESRPIKFALAKPDKPLILLETFVNGSGPFCFILDTGAGSTIISPQLSRKLGVGLDHPEKPDKATGAGGTLMVHGAKVESIRIGEVTVPNMKVGVMDLDAIGKAIETQLDGIIGYNFLRKFRVTIDYPNQTVSFDQ